MTYIPEFNPAPPIKIGPHGLGGNHPLLIIARLVEKRDARRDSFVEVIKKAMGETLAPDAEEALKLLQKHGVTKTLAKEATEIAQAKGAFTIFAVVDALTRLSSRLTYTGDRAAIDEKASSLLALAA
jgi:hypothetical protein